MNKNIKKVLSRCLVSSLGMSIMLMNSNVYALAKDETVYANLDANGSVKNVLVNDYLNNYSSLDSLEDYSDLKDIINLSGDEKFTYLDSKLTWEASGKDILYQGKSDKDLPVSESISYKLNGEDISLDDLLGKKGNVEITIKYENKDAHEMWINGKYDTLYTPFVVTTAMKLDTAYNKNINVTNGKATFNGNSYLIASISAPGMYESLGLDSLKDLDKVIISFDTTNFMLPNIYTIATPKLIEDTDLSIFSKMDSMFYNINELQKNMNILEENSKIISNNLNTVSEGMNEVYNALNVVLNSVSELKNGTESLDASLKLLLESIDYSRNILSNEESESILSKVKMVYEMDRTTIEALKVNEEENAELITLLSYNMEVIDTFLNSISAISGSLDNMSFSVRDILYSLSDGASKINTGVSSLLEGMSVLTNNVEKLSIGVKELSNGANEFAYGMEKFNKEGINTLSSYANKGSYLSNRIKKLTELSDNYTTFSASNLNSKDASTKFIYVVNSVKVKENKKSVSKSEEKETFIDRVKNLFK